MKVDIIIPTYLTVDLTLRCIESINENTQLAYRLILIDDGNERGAFYNILFYSRLHWLDFIYHRFEKNKGFASAINQGIRLSDSEHLVFMNNDVIVTRGWLGKLVEALEKSPRTGLVAAVTDNISSVCRYDRLAKVLRIKVKEDPENFFNSLAPGTIPFETNISFFCVAIKREVVKSVGFLDERFYNGGEDDDYNDRIRRAGYLTAVCRNCFVYHDHSATFNKMSWISRERNRSLLKEKRARR